MALYQLKPISEISAKKYQQIFLLDAIFFEQ